MSTSKPQPLAFSQAPLVDADGRASLTAIKQFTDIFTRVWGAIDSLGQIVGTITGQIASTAKIQGRAEGIGTTVQHIGSTGVVQSAGMVAATDTTQGAVLMPVGHPLNILGSAAVQDVAAFDAAGSAAAALSAAQAFATNGSNVSAGTIAGAYIAPLSSISGAISATQLPASVPVVGFGVGAPAGSSIEGYIYFDTTGTPYHGYVYHSSAWVQFS